MCAGRALFPPIKAGSLPTAMAVALHTTQTSMYTFPCGSAHNTNLNVHIPLWLCTQHKPQCTHTPVALHTTQTSMYTYPCGSAHNTNLNVHIPLWLCTQHKPQCTHTPVALHTTQTSMYTSPCGSAHNTNLNVHITLWFCTQHKPQCTHHPWFCTQHKPQCTHHPWFCTQHKPQCTHHPWFCTQHKPQHHITLCLTSNDTKLNITSPSVWLQTTQTSTSHHPLFDCKWHKPQHHITLCLTANDTNLNITSPSVWLQTTQTSTSHHPLFDCKRHKPQCTQCLLLPELEFKITIWLQIIISALLHETGIPSVSLVQGSQLFLKCFIGASCRGQSPIISTSCMGSQCIREYECRKFWTTFCTKKITWPCLSKRVGWILGHLLLVAYCLRELPFFRFWVFSKIRLLGLFCIRHYAPYVQRNTHKCHKNAPASC